MRADDVRLEVYQAGPITVLGFGGEVILDQIDIVHCRQQIIDLVRAHECHTLAFDLTGIRLIPSGILGLFVSLRELKVRVQVYNPSPDVQEVLELSRLSEVLEIHHIDPP